MLSSIVTKDINIYHTVFQDKDIKGCIMKKLSLILLLFTKSILLAQNPISYSIDKNNILTAQFELDGSVDEVWKLITDYENSDKIMPNVKKTVILSRQDNLITVETTVGSGPFSMTYTAIMTEIPKTKKLLWQQKDGPFSKNRGSWHLTSLPGKRTKVTYEIEMDHKLLPDGLRQKLVKGSIPELYESLQNNLKNKE